MSKTGASEDDVCSVVQNINDELDDPNISVRWAILPERPEEPTTEDSTVDSAHYLDKSKQRKRLDQSKQRKRFER